MRYSITHRHVSRTLLDLATPDTYDRAMSNKLSLGFVLTFLGDGLSHDVVVNLATAPLFKPASAGSTLTLSLAAGDVTDVVDLTGDSSTGAVTLSALALGIATLHCANVPTAAYHTLTGTLLF